MNKGPTHRPTVAVIGGGISGLSVAFWLLRKGVDVMVFEKSGRPGGVIKSEHVNGYLIDHAANCLLNFLPEVDTLCDVVGVRDERVYRSEFARNRYLLKDSRPVPLPRGAAEFIHTDLLSFKGKTRLLSEPFIPRMKRGMEETVSQFVIRRFGREILDQVMEPFISGTYAGDPLNLCVKSTLPRLYFLEQRYGSLIIGAIVKRLRGSRAGCPMHLFSFHQGMETLPMAVKSYIGRSFINHSKVEGIERKGNSWRIIVEGNNGDIAYDSDAVVIATPSIEAARLIYPLDSKLSEMLHRVEYSPLAVVYTGFNKDSIQHPLNGIGCMVPLKEGRNILGTLWNSTLFSGRAPQGMALLTNYIGGRRHPGFLEKDDKELLNRTLTDLRDVLHIRGEPDFARITRYERAIPQYSIGHQDMLKRVEEIPERVKGIFLTGNYLRGISVRDCISYGASVADRLVNSLSPSLYPSPLRGRDRVGVGEG